MTESIEARRERIAEQLFIAMVQSENLAFAQLPNVLATMAREWANVFCNAGSQTEPKDKSVFELVEGPTLLEAAKVVIELWENRITKESFDNACYELHSAILREEGERD